MKLQLDLSLSKWQINFNSKAVAVGSIFLVAETAAMVAMKTCKIQYINNNQSWIHAATIVAISIPSC